MRNTVNHLVKIITFGSKTIFSLKIFLGLRQYAFDKAAVA